MISPWEDFERHRGYVNQQAENASRHALAMGTFLTTGWGEVVFSDCFDFEMTFTERPTVSYGVSLGGDNDLVATRYPRATGGVYRWKQDVHEFYTGAWCYVTIDTRSPFIATSEAEPGYTLYHDFLFQGNAVKVLPDYLADF